VYSSSVSLHTSSSPSRMNRNSPVGPSAAANPAGRRRDHQLEVVVTDAADHGQRRLFQPAHRCGGAPDTGSPRTVHAKHLAEPAGSEAAREALDQVLAEHADSADAIAHRLVHGAPTCAPPSCSMTTSWLCAAGGVPGPAACPRRTATRAGRADELAGSDSGVVPRTFVGVGDVMAERRAHPLKASLIHRASAPVARRVWQ
jgi:hypothetical protein